MLDERVQDVEDDVVSVNELEASNCDVELGVSVQEVDEGVSLIDIQLVLYETKVDMPLDPELWDTESKTGP